ncbi:MAG: Fur family transcriptional regulator [Bacillota bacterium]|nr:Fur family transcriptional regulator [Bacillota bacterium]
METKIARIAEILREQDLRLTPQRQAVMEILLSNIGEHLNAEEIFKAAREKYPELGLATVYRTLELLVDIGVVNKIQFNEDCSRYEYNPADGDKHSHHHLICLQCGGITEFDEDLLDELEKKIARQNNFAVTDHCLRFYGYCAKCRSK